jgi:hypothetical protein
MKAKRKCVKIGEIKRKRIESANGGEWREIDIWQQQAGEMTA